MCWPGATIVPCQLVPLFEREQIRDAAGPSEGARLVELIDPGRRPNWPGDALDREGTFRLAKLARVVEEYERTPSPTMRSEEHTSELQSLMSNSYAVFCLKKKI